MKNHENSLQDNLELFKEHVEEIPQRLAQIHERKAVIRRLSKNLGAELETLRAEEEALFPQLLNSAAACKGAFAQILEAYPSEDGPRPAKQSYSNLKDLKAATGLSE